jgi:hypothetical protein
MRVTPEKTNYAVLRVHSDAIAVCVLPRRRDDRPYIHLLEFSDSLKCIAHLPRFDVELMLIIHVLIRATAAPPEIRAGRRYAMRRTGLNLDQLCFGKLLLFSRNFGRHQLAFDRVRHKHHLPLFPPDSLPAERDVFDSQVSAAHAVNTLLLLSAPAKEMLEMAESGYRATTNMNEVSLP